MYNPIGTYRIQFNKEFTFKEFEQVILYLKKLGVGSVYASPVFKAVPGTNHGYDGLNPLEINPEIGSLDDLKNINRRLKKENIGWIQDIVPNHMAYHHGNKWLMDVLEKGQRSSFASIFDILWDKRINDGKLMAPFLMTTLQQAIRSGEIKLAWLDNRLALQYQTSFFPINPCSYGTIFEYCDQSASDALKKINSSLKKILETRENDVFAKQWDKFLSQFGDLRNEIDNYIGKINSDLSRIEKIAGEQVYRLCHWKETDLIINYRRFFTVNGLICLNIQDENVFNLYHQFILSLARGGIFQGLRIDHIDGLYDPGNYLQRLRKTAGEQTFVVVEKILEHHESLPQDWETEGTTGYDFLSLVNNLFTNIENEKAFTGFFQEFTRNYSDPEDKLFEKKSDILSRYMRGEMENLYQLLLTFVDKRTLAAIYPDDLRNAIGEFLAHCPVYRYYGNKLPLEGKEAEEVNNIFSNEVESGKVKPQAVDVLRKVFLETTGDANGTYNENQLHFYKRCMQFTGPLMAKGLEDTLSYTYARFIAHNEVGDNPADFGISQQEFHQAMIQRQQRWPLTLNATSTHDTKMGEDIRAILNVLSDLPEEWTQHVSQWHQTNSSLKQNNIPAVNDEYYIYQILMGAYPLQESGEENFTGRFMNHLQKVLREEKINSDWEKPNQAYEQATKNFAAALLDKKNLFFGSFISFRQKILDFGIIQSLCQLLLKFTCPGIPDVYQGTELWDLNLVDPDNRRKVDFDLRLALLDKITQEENAVRQIETLWEGRHGGGIKLWLMEMLFNLRKKEEDFFEKAEYIPLQVKGSCHDFVFAFARKYNNKWIIVAVPLHLASLCKQQQTDIFSIDWKDTQIVLPKQMTGKAENIFYGSEENIKKTLSVQKFFSGFPILLLKTEAEANERTAGVLLHITSLPSKFGIGDFGPEAYSFADTLNNCHLKIWQTLPLNPIDSAQAYSPYSPSSSFAGNTLLISPELLAKERLIGLKDLESYYCPQNDTADFVSAEKNRNEIFSKVWGFVKENKNDWVWEGFDEFCQKEKQWLNDFAIYTVIKRLQQGNAWYRWPEEFKKRKRDALEKIFVEQEDEIEKINFFQFIFMKQWNELKEYCNKKGIRILGDLPLYVSCDSADVWSHPEIFNIDEGGNIIGMAGTPGDYFSTDGQLWGMPVFKWETLKESNYKWWIDRFKRNEELFDIVRLDHFRAFAAYWEVPAKDKTARNGSWKPGPGAAFFDVVKKELGELPFVAEDLGDIDEDVTALRDRFNFPGMKIMQFAFDDQMPDSDHIPHNYPGNSIVYTGTHDNNTTRGWYKQNTDEKTKRRIEQYCGREITEESISFELMRLAYSSIARTAIIPLQDILNLDDSARMNTPARTENNWRWRLLPSQFSSDIQSKIKEMVWLYRRNY